MKEQEATESLSSLGIKKKLSQNLLVDPTF